MYIRHKKNKSNTVSVQVIDKSTSKYKVVKSFGSSNDESELKRLNSEAENWIKSQKGLLEIDFDNIDGLFEQFIGGIDSIFIAGIDLLLGQIFDSIGFNKIKDSLFKQLVLARLCYPHSKLKTVDYLARYQGFHTNEDKIYRYLDKLNNSQKRLVQQISYDHTLKILEGNIQMVFYDVTTLYFEIKEEDSLRKAGFSKDGKHQNPQIVLGLLVSNGGYPLAYEIFNGKKFEGDTMLPIINLFKRKYKFTTLTVVADAVLLSNKNIASLKRNNYQYILGARIKNETSFLKKQIQNLKLTNGQSAIIQKKEHDKLIISYSDERAKKDAHNRARGIDKLEKKLKSNKLTKTNINNKGYNKFLKMEGEVLISIDKTKIEDDKKWDGLKGYVTNCHLNNDEIISNYKHLWMIEKAFRISKSEIEIRPIYHQIGRRIEAHICLSFVAYKVYMELKRQLKEKNAEISTEKAIEIAKTIYKITAIKPKSHIKVEKVLLLTEEQRILAKLFNF
jgi:transposase